MWRRSVKSNGRVTVADSSGIKVRSGDAFGWTFEATRRRQALLGLQLTPAERLQWLETTLAQLLPLAERARAASTGSTQSDAQNRGDDAG